MAGFLVPEYKIKTYREAFENRSISFKIKTHEDFNHSNILNISRIEIRMQRGDWAKGDVFERSHRFCRKKHN